MRRPYRSASKPNINAPTGRNASVRVMDNAICGSDLPNSFPIAVRQKTTRKKSNASRVHPKRLARKAETRSAEVSVAGLEALGAINDPPGFRNHYDSSCLSRALGPGLNPRDDLHLQLFRIRLDA